MSARDRRRAVQTQEDVAALRDGLTHPDAGVRALSAQALAAKNDTESRAAIEALVTDDHFAVRAAAARALGELGDPSAADAVLPLLEAPELLVKRYAIRALAKLGAGSAFDGVLAALDDPDLVGEAVTALGRLKNPAAIGALGRLLADDRCTALALQALGRIAHPSGVPVLLAAGARGLRATDHWWATAALRELGDWSALRAAARTHPDAEARQLALRALESDPDVAARIDLFITAFNEDEATAVRRKAIGSLAGWELPEEAAARVRALFEAALNDPDEDVRHYAEEGLAPDED